MNKKLIIKYEPKNEKKNIDYIFQKLITSLAMAFKSVIYIDDRDEIKYICDNLIEMAIIYDETKNLQKIDFKELELLESKLYDLDGKYLSSNGLYMEEAYEWVLQLITVYKKI